MKSGNKVLYNNNGLLFDDRVNSDIKVRINIDYKKGSEEKRGKV